MQTETNQEIVQILYAHGHSTYHPVLADALEEFVNTKVKEAEPATVNDLLIVAIANAITEGNLEAVTVYTQAFQRLN